MATVKLMFDGVEQECLVVTDKNGETVCYAKDHRFVKFPAGVKLADAVKKHNKHNAEVPLPPEDTAQAEELAAWLD